MTRTLALTVTLVLIGFAGFQSSYVTSGQSDFKTILRHLAERLERCRRR